MSTLLRLTLLLRRSGDRRAALVGAGSYALVTLLLLVTLGGGHAFLQWHDADAGSYQFLAGMALVLLVVPLLYLGAAAARLSARAQDRRLSTLRLVGATGRQVAAVTVLGAALEAGAGALAGTVTGTALLPLVSLVHFRGAALGGAVWLPWYGFLGVVLAVTALGALAATAGLRSVVLSPLGVRTRAVHPVPSWARVVVGLGLVVLGVIVTQSMHTVAQVAGTAGAILSVLGVMMLGLVALNALGPWVVRRWGLSRLRRATTAESLLAARSVLDDPAAVWRQVSGAAMAGFVAVVGGVGAALMSTSGGGVQDPFLVQLGVDVRTGVFLTLIIAFTGVVCTTAVSQAATVLDREELTEALGAMGTPPSLLQRARVNALMGPLVLVLLVAVIASALLVFPLAGFAAIVSPITLLAVAALCFGGVMAVRGAAAAAGRIGTQASRSDARVGV